jgi:type IV secretion system protein VirB11
MNEPVRRQKIDYSKVMQLGDDTSVRQLITPLNDVLKREGVTEVAINEPNVVFYEQYGEWKEMECPGMDFKACNSLAVAIASYTQNDISEENTILSAQLPDDERIQVIVAPTVPKDTVSFTIRIPNATTKSMEGYEQEGFFKRAVTSKKVLKDGDAKLLKLYEEGNVKDFMVEAVLARKNIAVVGDTGSGKTTFMKTLCQLIPVTDRIVTIEDTRELFLAKHRNKVHLTYSTQGKAKVTPAMLIKSCMRMKPDRVLPAELRGAEAFDFVDLLTTGHSGSITSFHAENCSVAFERFALMCKKHPDAGAYTHAELLRLLTMTIDVICHIERHGQQRFISEIYFDPQKKMQAAGH